MKKKFDPCSSTRLLLFHARLSSGADAIPKFEYDVLTVATTDRTIPVDYSATIRGRQDIAIYAQVSGKIAQVCINEGQRVRNGQTLFHHRPGSL